MGLVSVDRGGAQLLPFMKSMSVNESEDQSDLDDSSPKLLPAKPIVSLPSKESDRDLIEEWDERVVDCDPIDI